MTIALPLLSVLSNQLVDLHSFRYLLPILVPLSIALGPAGLWTLHCGQSLLRHRR